MREPLMKYSAGKAFVFGGCWNSQGNRIVYLSETLSRAAFEILIHTANTAILQPYLFLRVELPEELIMALDDNVLPPDWKEPFNDAFQTIRDAWIASNQSLGLSVPSAVIPGERNVILRPTHQDFKQVRVGTIEYFSFDKRIFAKQRAVKIVQYEKPSFKKAKSGYRYLGKI
jgi:RES domain-containing protein